MTALAVFAAVIGAIVGSFLNACIHRMPRGIPLSSPRRSFCPSCNKMIPWYENLPLVSWLALRGKCSACGAKIPVRYLVVEGVTAVAFTAAWLRFGLPLAPIYWAFLALMIAATFIDIEHFIIPDEITWGGAALGFLCSVAVPELMGTDSRWMAAMLSAGGAVLGFGMLWAIVEIGKIAFGKKTHLLSPSEPFMWVRSGESATLTIGSESMAWEDIFSRESDVLTLECDSVDGRDPGPRVLSFFYNRVVENGATTSLDAIDRMAGVCSRITIPREAMGFGDVKFIAAIGAFLGWKAVLFTLCAASVIGCVAALGGLFLARDRGGSRIPFGPFLALGAVVWVFGGDALWDWYFGVFRGSRFEILDL
jgi:leader peptidase (prepilin peptidase)/N-methyltransferase